MKTFKYVFVLLCAPNTSDDTWNDLFSQRRYPYFSFFFLKNNQDCVFCAIISFLATVNDNAFHIFFMIYWRVSLITFGAFYLVSIIFSAS